MKFLFSLTSLQHSRNDEGHREVAGILQSPGEWMVADPAAPKEEEPSSTTDESANNEAAGKGE